MTVPEIIDYGVNNSAVCKQTLHLMRGVGVTFMTALLYLWSKAVIKLPAEIYFTASFMIFLNIYVTFSCYFLSLRNEDLWVPNQVTKDLFLGRLLLRLVELDLVMVRIDQFNKKNEVDGASDLHDSTSLNSVLKERMEMASKMGGIWSDDTKVDPNEAVG